MKKKIVILGSSGSIGTQTLEVIDVLETIEVVGLTVNSNIKLLESQIKKYKPKKVAIMNKEAFKQIENNPVFRQTEVYFGIEGIVEVATMESADLIVNALVGSVGLLPTIKALENKKNIALANKETLIMGGSLIMPLAEKNGVKIYPIDSEHSAIFQCLQGNAIEDVNKLYLTASGGPFRNKSKVELENVTLEEALKHPNWTMGQKVTIDSATLMNKGLEVIEAKWLFNMPLEKIEVLIQPESIIHSMVEYNDSSVIAQLGKPDMRVPISYALNYPNRVNLPFEKTNFLNYTLNFEKPDTHKFPCLGLAYFAMEVGKTMPVVLNAANEIAVENFLANKIKFTDIPKLVEFALNKHEPMEIYTVDDILKADRLTRDVLEEYLSKV